MWETRIFQFFLIWYTCGVILLSFDLLPPWLEWANVVFLMLAGTLGAIYLCRSYGLQRGLVASLIIFVVSMYSEYLGTTYGWIFGKYVYTSDFGMQLFGVPITIGFAWLLVMGTSHAFLQVLRLPYILYIAYGGIIAVALDLILDPVAFVAKNYWIWQDSGPYYGIPTQNFIGWFFIASLLHSFLHLYLRPAQSSDHPAWHKRMILLYALIAAMFILLALLAGLYLAAIVTCICVGTIIIHYTWKRRTLS